MNTSAQSLSRIVRMYYYYVWRTREAFRMERQTMKDFFARMNEKIRQMMSGRWGADQLSRFLLGVAVVFLLLTFFTGSHLFSVLGLAVLLYSYYRMFSKNFEARRRENDWYLARQDRVTKTLRIQKKRFSDRHEFRYFKCPGCGQSVRVPKGKGHIMITCPRCRTQFDKTV